MTDTSDPSDDDSDALGNGTPDDDPRNTHVAAQGERRAWTSDELSQLAERMLHGRELTEVADTAFADHPELAPDAVEYVDDDDLAGGA
jgi:hypothetical protein